MKPAIILLLLALVLSCSKQQRTTIKEHTAIDSIAGLKDMRNFVKLADSTLTRFVCKAPKFHGEDIYTHSKTKHLLDSMFPNFEVIKEDFDNNGYTDLIVTGSYSHHSFDVLAIMSHGKNQYKTIPLTLSLTNDFPVYPKLVYKKEKPAIALYSHANFADEENNGIGKRTLVYKYDNFIDYTEPTETYQISQIEYSTSGCLGTCPIFELIVNDQVKSTFIAKYYNFSKERFIANQKEEGIFETTIDKDDYAEICQIINELQVKRLSDFYFSGGTCQPSSTLKVHFADGTTKTIEDYGKIGTNGLYVLYGKLADLRFNQDWEKL